MNLFERYLTLWVAICIVIGIVLGWLMPGVFQAIGALEIAKAAGGACPDGPRYREESAVPQGSSAGTKASPRGRTLCRPACFRSASTAGGPTSSGSTPASTRVVFNIASLT